jgi:hypothetical protein
VDAFTKFARARIVRNKSAAEICRHLLEMCVGQLPTVEPPVLLLRG